MFVVIFLWFYIFKYPATNTYSIKHSCLTSITITHYYASTCNNAALTASIAVAAAEVAEDTPTEVTGDTPTTEACPGLLVSGECTSANSGTDVTER